MTNFIETYEGVISDDLCDRVVARLEELLDLGNPHLSGGYLEGMKTNSGYANRQDYSHNFLVSSPELNMEMHQAINPYVGMYCEKYPSYGMTPCVSTVSKVQKTRPKGGFHTWHCEHGYADSTDLRRLTWTIYLNDVPEGEGETEFLEYGIKVQPKKGDLCFFPAGWTHTHRGNPVYTTDKYIATGWYYLS